MSAAGGGDLARVRDDFDRIARLGERHESGSPRYDRFLLSLVPGAARHVLDVGCGTGRLTRALARPGRQVLGIDLSPEMVARARARAAGVPGLTFLCGDFLALELDPGRRPFDAIVTAATLHHMPAEDALSRMKRLLAPGGRLVVHDVRASGGWWDDLRGLSVLSWEATLRLLRTGWPLSPAAVRRAWAEHGAGERYLTRAEATELGERCLPGARLHWHWSWRYTLVWEKPADAPGA